VLFRTLKGVHNDELNLDLQRVHEWVAANGLKLNLMKSQVIVISRCRCRCLIEQAFVNARKNIIEKSHGTLSLSIE
jgi:hypothetical protein